MILQCHIDFKIGRIFQNHSDICFFYQHQFRPLDLFLPPGNHLPISFVIFLYFFSLQFCNLIFLFLVSLLPSILGICSLQFILYCVNLWLILKMSNCSLMSLLLSCPKVFLWSKRKTVRFSRKYFYGENDIFGQYFDPIK